MSAEKMDTRPLAARMRPAQGGEALARQESIA